MSDTQFIQIMEYHKEVIISKWYKALTEQYPGFYNYERLMQETYLFFDYLLDLEISQEQHSINQTIPHMCEYFFKRDIHIAHIIHSNQLWVDAILFFVQEDNIGQTIPLSFIRKIIARVYEYEKNVLRHYYAITRGLLERHERTITDLHEARLSIVGKMAASMAHEIRNPLTTILGFLKIIRAQILNNNSEKLLTYLDMIQSEFQNIQMQITGFLSFSKKDIIEEPFVSISANSLIQSVLAMITPRLINYNINFLLREGEDIQLTIQKIAVQQVLSNILNNSIDALSEIDEDKKLTVLGQKDGDLYIISVSNNGPEIPMEMKDSLFEPFVSGKEEGTGLGLAICKQIMAKNLGDVTFISDKTETIFFVKFRINND